MIKKLSDNIAEVLANGNVIQHKDKSKCSYGIDIMFSSVSEILCIIVLSTFVRNFFETLLFFVMFVPLRIYAGGYHADTRLSCFAILVGVYIIFSVFTYIGSENLYPAIIYGGMIFTLLMVLTAAPVMHSRKHLTKNEIQVFRRFAIIICCIEIALILITLPIFGCSKYLLSCVFGQLAVSLSMTAACIKKYLTERRSNNEEVL